METLRSAILSGRSFVAVHGSMLINVSSGRSGGDPDVANVVRDFLDEQLRMLRRGIRARFPGMEAAESQSLAQTLQALVISALTLVRLDPEWAARNLDVALSMLGDCTVPSG